MNGPDEIDTNRNVNAAETVEGPTMQPNVAEYSSSKSSGLGNATQGSFGASVPPPVQPRRPSIGFAVPPGVQDALEPLRPVGKQYLAWIGSALLLVTLFAFPAKTYSYSVLAINASASRTLWDYGTFWGVILLLLALASIALAYVRDYQWLVVTGAISFLILLLNFLYTFSGVLGLSAHPSWGWILLFPSALIIMAAGAMRSTPRDAENPNGLGNIVAQVQNRSAGA